MKQQLNIKQQATGKFFFSMNPKDYQGIFKWKFLIPCMYITSWLLMIFGPIFFPYGYQIYCISIIVYSLLKTMGLTFGALVALIILYRTIKQLKQIKEKQSSKSDNKAIIQGILYHVIVIPSYKEDEQVLLQTLDMLAKSQRAKKQFIILMAMEAHQKGSDQKAKNIIQKSKQKFLYMTFSQHQVRDGQSKGKASNVSWCVEHLQQMIPRSLMLSPKDIMLSIIDADSWAPVQYFEKIQIQLKQRPQIKDRCMFSVPQIYTRNHLDVPIFNRIYDQMHSLVHLANLVAVHYSFPLSNYTISYNLSKKIGWWDTCADAIGEDFHTCQKCYWKLKDQTFVTVPIYVPFNQVSLSTGEGWVNDVKARFWQAERHTLGVSDVAYCWNMLFKKRFMFRNLILTLLVTQVFAMAAVIPWALLALGIQYKLVSNQSIHFFQMWVIDLLLNATPIFTVSSYVFYEWWKRVSNRLIYRQQNDPWWRVLQYPILFMFALFGFSVPSFLMASFAVLCSTTQYRVAEKHLDKNKTHSHGQFQLHQHDQPKLLPSYQPQSTNQQIKPNQQAQRQIIQSVTNQQKQNNKNKIDEISLKQNDQILKQQIEIQLQSAVQLKKDQQI